MTKSGFADLVRLISRKLYGFAFRILRNQEEAEDAVQDVFVKLWKMGDKLDKYDSPEALATTMIKNYCIDQIRKQKHFKKEEHSDLHNNPIVPSPHDQMEINESDAIVHIIIDQLPDTFRDMIRLKDIDGFTYEEIAKKTDQNINTLRVTISRARKLIREEYNKYQTERRRLKSTD
jgi:RNA polymerase sigma-70 factor (ECF subfamily)